MIKKQFFLKRIFLNPLFSGSAVMIAGSNAANFINYVYHLIMGRMLGPANYGELAALFSMVGILGMLPFSLGLVVTKFVSRTKNLTDSSQLIGWLEDKVFILSLTIFILIALSSYSIASFLNIKNSILVLAAATTFIFSIPAASNRAVLQGLLKFKQIVFSSLSESFTRLLIGILLVYLGFSVLGAISGLLISTIVGFLLSKILIGKKKDKNPFFSPNIREILGYSFPVIIQTVAITSLYSTDVLLVKHFFDPHAAGIYASLSTLGRIIFFGTSPISAVMFPMVSKRQSLGKNHTRIFLLSLVLTMLISTFVLVIYLLLPVLSVKVLFGPSFIEGSDLLIWFGIFMSEFSLASLFINYFLSLGKTSIVLFAVLSALIQGAGIWVFHDTLYQVIRVSIFSISFLIVCLFFQWSRIKNNLIS